MAFDAFLKLDGIKGESTDAKHPGEIEIESFIWGASAPSTSVSVTDFQFTAAASKASPQLFEKLVDIKSGNINEALLTIKSSGAEQTTYTIKLTNCEIASYNQGGSDDGGILDEFALRWGKIELNYDGEIAVYTRAFK